MLLGESRVAKVLSSILYNDRARGDGLQPVLIRSRSNPLAFCNSNVFKNSFSISSNHHSEGFSSTWLR